MLFRSKEVTVNIPTRAGIKGKDLKIDIKASHITVKYANGEVIIDGDLHKRVIVDDCCWQLEDSSEGRIIVVYLTKSNPMEWWSCAIQGDEEIDITKIEPESSNMKDLDPDTRAQVEKMMFDQQQKQMGLPTSEERQKQQMIDKLLANDPSLKEKFANLE